jgi:hypothetical protein
MLAAMVVGCPEKRGQIWEIQKHMLEEQAWTVKDSFDQGRDIDIHELL